MKQLTQSQPSARQARCRTATGVIAFELQASYRIAASPFHRFHAPRLEPYTPLETPWLTGESAPPSIRLLEANTHSWAPFIGLVVVVIFCAAAWILAPKGENQTYVILPCAKHKRITSPDPILSPSTPRHFEYTHVANHEHLAN